MYIDISGVKERLNTKCFGQNIVYLESVDSTNSYLKNLHNPANGTLVIAEAQTGGRGRRGRSFWSPHGGIYMSLICEAPQNFDAGKLTSSVALSVCKAIESITRLTPRIKWVNDIFLNGRKVCGILCEAITDPTMSSVKSVVIGIGINIAELPLPDELKHIVTSLNREWGEEVPRENLIAELLNNLEKDFKTIDTDEFIEELRRRSLVLGRKITVHSQTESYEALAIDLDKSCRLVVKRGEETIILSSGEVSVSNN